MLYILYVPAVHSHHLAKMELIKTSPNFADVRFQDGRDDKAKPASTTRE